MTILFYLKPHGGTAPGPFSFGFDGWLEEKRRLKEEIKRERAEKAAHYKERIKALQGEIKTLETQAKEKQERRRKDDEEVLLLMLDDMEDFDA